jgi:transposase-like protein
MKTTKYSPEVKERAVRLMLGGEAVELATLEWVTWFNHQRLLKSIGFISPSPS